MNDRSTIADTAERVGGLPGERDNPSAVESPAMVVDRLGRTDGDPKFSRRIHGI